MSRRYMPRTYNKVIVKITMKSNDDIIKQIGHNNYKAVKQTLDIKWFSCQN